MAFLQKLFVNLQCFDAKSKVKKCESPFSDIYTLKAKTMDTFHDDESTYFIQCDPSNTVYCAKVSKNILFKATEQEKLLQEVLILKNVIHPAILEFKGFNLYDFDQTPRPTIITLFMEKGSLEDVVAGKLEMNDSQKQICIVGVASAMCYLHRLQITHRNLKLSNVLLDDNLHPKVSDFGLYRRYSKDDYEINLAPEIIDNDSYDEKADVYSFAILCYQLITGKSPFKNSKGSELYDEVIESRSSEDTFLSYEGCDISEEFKELINGCYHIDPKKRIDFENIYSRLLDDCSLVINDKVDMVVVSKYIKEFSKNTTEKGKAKLEICSLEDTIVVEQYTKEKDEPSEPKNDEAMIKEIVMSNFSTKLDKASQMKILNKKYTNIIHDTETFAKVTVYANNLELSNDKNASHFLKKAFNELRFDGKEKINFNDVKTVRATKFFNLNLSSNVVSIEENAFKGTDIQYINLRPTLKSIGPEAFKYCKKLVFVNLNNEMTVINKGTFEKCKDLSYVLLPDGLNTIEERAFKDCTSLTSIYIPPSVKKIGNHAFKGCINLNDVHMSRKTKFDRKKSFPACAMEPNYYD